MERTIVSVIVIVHRCKGWSQGNVVGVVTRLCGGQLWNLWFVSMQKGRVYFA